MSRLLYFLGAFAESSLSVFGVRAPYEQPAYTVSRTLSDGVEIRAYAPRVAVETDIADGNDGESFGRLFRYISGANQGGAGKVGETIAMTAPVQQGPAGSTLAMTVPVEMAGVPGTRTMRFFLPRAVATNPPAPTDPKVRIVRLPASNFAVIRFSGTLAAASREAHATRLRAALRAGGISASGPSSVLSYDPPFAIPFLRRNEIALPVDGA